MGENKHILQYESKVNIFLSVSLFVFLQTNILKLEIKLCICVSCGYTVLRENLKKHIFIQKAGINMSDYTKISGKIKYV